ncbi:hypothetical protein KGA66_00380 [Actinocrinis puniceicyclus]|uniref:Uncharacterized protein n=1 Tax=Actinocrinis puniceicyclus TaxID=977794 RepID=A0A8J8BAK0_9ACTN|nr:hypothetical protein [Actinocrinis puniceicyclus]MBS2961480.1 hypothetical protein [Actinocrinis puniceicyclus]
MTDVGQDKTPGGTGGPDAPFGPIAPVRRRRRLRPRSMLVLALAAVLLVGVGLEPWALHIGGRFTPNMTWSGYGEVQASNGGKYELYVHLRGGLLSTRRVRCGHTGGCSNLIGDAKLCGRNGATEDMALTGSVHTWWSTDGARTMLLLNGGSPVKLPAGWVVAFGGTWQGPNLVVEDTDNSFTEPFTPDGAIRTTTSTADAGTAAVTLRSGSADDFARACRALKQ